MKKYICQEKSKGKKRIRVKVIAKEGRSRIGVEHIGVAHNEEELKMFLALAQERLRDKRQEEFKFKEFEEKGKSTIIHKKSYSRYLYDTLGKIYDERLKLKVLRDEIFKQITLARIIKPGSKLETSEVLKELGLEYPSEAGIRRCLDRIKGKDYRKVISLAFIRYAKIKRASLLLYDVTTLYFEISKEDEYRKSGLSKERRLEPQIIIGLLVDGKGFPLGINSFEGNKAETKTLIPVLKGFREKCGIKELTVAADAGMMSASNLEELEEAGFKFIVGSRIAKTPYEIEEYRKKEEEELIDGQMFETVQSFTNKKGGKEKKRRVIYQYKQKRAEVDLRNIDKQIKRAQKQIGKGANSKKAKFVKIIAKEVLLDEKGINKARLKAGIKGYVTNLDCDGQIVINSYHNLFNVEKSFRMAKSDLKARPIFHQKRDSIEAHLTVCFAALGIERYIQERTKISIKKFVHRLELLRTAVIEIAGQQHIAEPEIDIETQKLVKML
jgi:transposase